MSIHRAIMVYWHIRAMVASLLDAQTRKVQAAMEDRQGILGGIQQHLGTLNLYMQVVVR